MRSTFFQNKHVESDIVNAYPDKLYKEAEKLKPYGAKKDSAYEEALKKIAAFGKKAFYWAIKANLDLVSYYEKGEEHKARLDEASHLLAEASLASSEYGVLAFYLFKHYSEIQEDERANHWLIESIKAQYSGALYFLTRLRLGYDNLSYIESVEKDVVTIFDGNYFSYNKPDKVKKRHLADSRATVALISCYQPKVYFNWKKYVATGADKDEIKWFIENVNPEKIIKDIYNSQLNLPLILESIYNDIKDSKLDPVILIDAVNNLLSFSESESIDKKLSDYVKDKMLYMKGYVLLHILKSSNEAKLCFKLIHPFNRLLYAEANFELGSYYMSVKKYAKSLKYFELALESDPKGEKVNLDVTKENILALTNLVEASNQNNLALKAN